MGAERRAIAFCTLWTSGPDTTLDGVFRIQAVRAAGGGGTWERFGRWCDPFPDSAGDAGAATARMVAEFGVSRAQVEGAPPAGAVWAELVDFLGDATIVVDEAESFEAWWAHLGGAGARAPDCVGLVEVAALFLPGRLAGRRQELAHDLCGDETARALPSPRAIGPEHLQAALGELVRRFLELDGDALALCAAGYGAAWERLAAAEPAAARRLALALEIVERPSAWRTSAAGALPLGMELADGRLSAAHEGGAEPADLVEGLEPRWSADAARWAQLAPLPPAKDGELTFCDEDRALLDDVFRVHLPQAFAAAASSRREKQAVEGAGSYRASQHQVAGAVAGTLGGAGGLLLVHAPTGTGKTLAYLLPLLVWARRHGLRAGVATYTRALQEQAMDREVPRALQALRRAGAATGFRVSLLKGRENYLCWRALKLQLPDETAGGEEWLAWTQMALFALTDGDGDLDRLPRRAPVPFAGSKRYRRALGELLRHARARTACCSHAQDRATCAAEVARRRAERSHVVITNHSFALARQEFLRHVVFDECEHLHDQAHAAWSHVTSLRWLRDIVARVHAGRSGSGSGSGSLLERVAKGVAAGSRAEGTLARCVARCTELAQALDGLEAQVEVFLRWREEARRGRGQSDEHSLLREYAEHERGAALVAARSALGGAGGRLEAELSELSERLDEIPLRGTRRLRRGLELARGDLHDALAGVVAWMPLDEGRPRFDPQTFHDVEVAPSGALQLAARVLLPNEYLGRFFYPQLASGVFLSATTWLKGGFDAARAYLGLDRAAEPAPEEERPPLAVRDFRAPEVFDYERVVVCAPNDAPNPSGDKERTLDYVRRFVAHLGERTRGRMLVLFTNSDDVRRVGARLEGFFRARRIPFWFQNMAGTAKEELSELFRRRVDSILFGVDTFWYGADYPGETLEYLVIVRLPYGVPDRYHHAQCAALGTSEQRRRIYMPRALAKFRQGFGRLMRRVTDRGAVFVLDPRFLDPRHRAFLRELPLRDVPGAGVAAGDGAEEEFDRNGARLVIGDTRDCVHAALAHMGMLSDAARRGLDEEFDGPEDGAQAVLVRERPATPEVPLEDLPF